MVTVSVKRLMSAIEEADVFRMPDMSVGADYLYNNLYKRLADGGDVRLSEIDFGSFELEDVGSMQDIYSDVFEANEFKAETIARTLRGIPPVSVAPAFV